MFSRWSRRSSRKHRVEKSAAEKIGAWQGLDDGDRQWMWTDGIQGESLPAAESGREQLSPPTTVQPSIR
jgi:hypothetical protein